MESAPKKEETKQNKFDWADEGLSALVRVVILSWSAAILTLNYVTIPGVPQKNIDPTFIALGVHRNFSTRSGLFLQRKIRKKVAKRKSIQKKKLRDKCIENHTSRKNLMNVQTFGGSGNLYGEKRFRCARGEKEMV